MSNYILLNRIEVQNANAIAGFTWGFPAITHFLGFVHNLSRKLSNTIYNDITLSGCAVISHNHQAHIYHAGDIRFTQTRNPPYLASHNKKDAPPIIEEGKMNMTVSLIIKFDGNIGNRQNNFINWLKNSCYLQRLAGGTILNIKDINIYTLNEENLKTIKRKLLPGFVLIDRSQYLAEHYQKLQQNNQNIELLDAWLDFIKLQQYARPKSNLLDKHILESKDEDLIAKWYKHLEKKYEQDTIPSEIKNYFTNIDNKKLSRQWQEYCNPNENTDANWQYLPKPKHGYLVPIMTGYKAISKEYSNGKIANTRDNKTDVYFVEAVHSIGEWLSAHRLTMGDFKTILWHYDYQKNWYLCKQQDDNQQNDNTVYKDPEDDY